jgi:hypothetical protein
VTPHSGGRGLNAPRPTYTQVVRRTTYEVVRGQELDENAGAVADRAVLAQRIGVAENTVRLIAKRFVETDGDVEATISRKQRETPPVPAIVTGEVEARLIALACSTPPQGYARWSLRLLEKHVALIDDVPDLDHSTIGRVLKKRNCVLI